MHKLLQSLNLGPAQGERMSLADYNHDYRQRVSTINGRVTWKLERRQHFQEPGFPSWEEFRRGAWDKALSLLDAQRDELVRSEQEAAARQYAFRRVRVVEEPLTPYLQWEIHALRIQAECGKGVRVVGPEHIRSLETNGTLPELVVLGDGETLYEVRYTDEGVADAAVRFRGAEIVTACGELMGRLYEEGEDVRTYFDRKVAHLPPPLQGQMTPMTE